MYNDDERQEIKRLKEQYEEQLKTIRELNRTNRELEQTKRKPKINKALAIENAYMSTGAHASHNLFEDTYLIQYPGGNPKRLEDKDEIELRFRLMEGGVDVHSSDVHDFLILTAEKYPFHPVRDYLDKLNWDGVPRLSQWMYTYLHARKADHIEKVSAVTLIAAVRRVRQPGCKFDNAPILISQEGSGKSTAIRSLAPNPDWYTDSLPISSDPKRVIEGSRGVWIVESAEMVGNRNVEMVKAFMSRQVDGPVRLAYARNSTSRPRQFIVIGSTNDQKPLRSQTGNRRFWPIVTGCVELEWLVRDKDLLWAEAAEREAAGESIYLDESLHPYVMDVQEKFVEVDPWYDTIEQKVTQLREAGQDASLVPVSFVWDWVGVYPRSQTTDQASRITAIMKKLHYVKDRNPQKCQLTNEMARVWRSIANPWDADSLDTTIAGRPGKEDYID